MLISLPAKLLEAHKNKDELDQEDETILKWLSNNYPEDIKTKLKLYKATGEKEQGVQEVLGALSSSKIRITWRQLVENIKQSLIKIGINPRGPKASLQNRVLGSQSKPWWNLYYEVLGTQNPNYTLQDQSDQETQDRRHCSERIVESIFFKGSKDLESTGIAAFDISLNEGFLGLNIDSAKEVILNTKGFYYAPNTGRAIKEEQLKTLL